jgi:hypothetical protein
MNPPPRSVGRYRRGAALLGALAGLAGFLGVLASPGDASPKEPPAARAPSRIGMNSCAARGCHGAVAATDPARGQVYIKDGAYTTWLRHDPHSRAYAVLLDDRSVKMAEKLKATLDDKPAHRAKLCLSCHATAEPKRAEVAPATDGISCEACHGPAEVWRDKHLSPGWRALAHLPIVKDADGMNNLALPTARAKLCVGCHVGDRSRGMDMNHDLIAAGHPRLNFEFSTYLAAYPKHWKEKGNPAEREAKSWAIGQVVTADAALKLLAARALDSESDRVSKPPAIWPEFSEYECFACHHQLANPGRRPRPGLAPGRFPWQSWPFSMLDGLARDRPGVDLGFVKGIEDEMGRADPDPKKVAALVDQGKAGLGELLKTLEKEALDPPRVAALMNDLARPASAPAPVEGWDRAVQRHLALQAMVRASRASGLAIPPAVEAAIGEGSKALDFPPGFDSPRGGPPTPTPTPRPGDPARPVR